MKRSKATMIKREGSWESQGEKRRRDTNSAEFAQSSPYQFDLLMKYEFQYINKFLIYIFLNILT